MKIKIYHLILFFFTLNNFSQETKISIKEYINFSDLPSKTSDTPRWADQFYTNLDQINIKNLKTEINDWIIEEKKERKEKRNKEIDKITNKASEKEFESELKESISENPIVRFAINFTKKIPSEWITDKGYFDLPTKSTFFKNAENQEKTRKTVNKKNEDKNVLASNWSQIGSMEIVQNDVQIVRSTNVYFISIAPSATDTRLASTETGVIFKTTDGGANWNYLNDYTGPSAFHPTDADKIILGSNPFRISSDGGATWTIKPVSSSCNEILWSNDGTTILAATNQGIYVSSDAGSSFSLKQTGTFMDVEFKPGSSTIAYAIDNAGNFYKSTNAGLTWVLKPTNYTLTTNKDGFLLGVTAANPDLVSIAFLTGQNTELIKSTNGGENFAPLSVYNTGFSQGYYDFVFGISPTDANIYFLGVTTLFKSIDGGLNFSALGGYSGAFGTHPDTQDLVMFGNNVVISTDGGVSVSSDNFTSLSNWHSTCKGMFALEYWGFDVGFNTDQMGGGKYHNGNNIFNTNWTNRKSIFLGGSEEATGKAILSRPNALSFSKYEDDVFKLIDVDYNPIVTNSSPITLSNNDEYYGTRGSDTTWNTIYSNIIYAGTENNVVISYDNGASSQILKNFNSRVWDIKTTRKDANVLYVMTETDGLWKTVDGGLNWTVCNLTVNSVNLKPSGLNCFIDVSQTNVNEIWLTYRNSNTTARISKSTDGGQTWTNLNTATLNQFESCQIIHQYGSNGGVYLMGKTNGIAKCYYRNNTMTDWIDYSSNLMLLTAAGDMFMKATYHKEKLRVAGTMGIQEVSFYEKSNPVAQPTTNIKDICVNQEIKFNDYSILDYTGASWEWSFSKVPTYLNGTTSGSQNPVVKFLSPGTVSATLKITNSSGASDSKTITNFINVNYDSANCLLLDSDHEIDLSCVNNIVSSPNIAEGSQVLVSNFDGATTGKFLVNLNFFTNCTGANGSLIAYVNLNTNQINVIRYNHFGGTPMDMLGNNTSTVTSPIGISAKVAFSISNHSLYLNHISNACSSSSYVRLSNSCWKPLMVQRASAMVILQNYKNVILKFSNRHR